MPFGDYYHRSGSVQYKNVEVAYSERIERRLLYEAGNDFESTALSVALHEIKKLCFAPF